MERLCTLNTATLSTRTYLAIKPAQNTLSHVQGHAFWDHWKADEGLYNNVDFRVRNFEGKAWASPFSRTPLSFGASTVYGTHANIHTTLHFYKLESLTYILPLIVWVYLHSNLSGRLRKMIFFLCKTAFRPFKVIEVHWFWYQSKARIMWLPISPL